MTARGRPHVYSVALRVAGELAEVQRLAIAAVPARFRLVVGPVADVVVLDAIAWAWPGLLHQVLGEGPSAIVMASRAPADHAAARAALQRAADAGVPVVFHTPFASSVAWRTVADAIAADASAARSLDSVATWSKVESDQVRAADRTLLDQLAVVRPLLWSATHLRTAHRSVGGYEIAGGGPLAVTLTGVAAPVRSSRLDLDLVSQATHWRIRFDAAPPAAPVILERADADGVHAYPLRFESGARASWAGLHDQLTGASPVLPDRTFIDDLELADSLLHREGSDLPAVHVGVPR